MLYERHGIRLITADCLEWMQAQPDNCVDMVLCSPPYSAARTYGIGFNLQEQAWVDWAIPRFLECLRLSRGLVAWVVEGQTRNYRYTAEPVLLMAELHKRGVKLRKPPIYHRSGIPGSGGPDWLRNDYEFIICATHGRLPWSDNKAMGHKPKYLSGGQTTHRDSTGKRTKRRAVLGGKQSLRSGPFNVGTRGAALDEATPSHGGRSGTINDDGTITHKNGKVYTGYGTANPGNVIRCKVGGGKLGHKLAHETEAPFPESLCNFLIRSFCPPNGTVLDIFSGSGTTIAAALKAGRHGIGVDIRESQLDLARRRLDGLQLQLC